MSKYLDDCENKRNRFTHSYYYFTKKGKKIVNLGYYPNSDRFVNEKIDKSRKGIEITPTILNEFVGALFGGSKGFARPVLGAGGVNALTQRLTGDKDIDRVQVGSSMLGAGFSSWAGNYLGQTSSLPLYSAQQYGLGRIGWTLETPINVFNAGFKKQEK